MAFLLPSLGAAARSRLPAAARGGVPLARMSAYARSLDATSIKGRHFDDLFSFTASELDTLLKISHALKDKMGKRKEIYQPLVSCP